MSRDLDARIEKWLNDNYHNTKYDVEEHIALVKEWLAENVHRATAVRCVKLHSFNADWKQMCGSFKVDFDGVPCPKVAFDGVPLPMDFTYGVGGNGHTGVTPPYFGSPLGAPASYKAVEMNEAAWDAICLGIRSLFPKVKPLGRDSSTGKIIDIGTRLSNRVLDGDAFSATRARISSPTFYLECEVKR